MLLVDLGNTRLKWAWWDGTSLLPGAPVDHAQPLRPQLERVWAGLPRGARTLIASVARDRLEAELAQTVCDRGSEPEFVRSRAAACGVTSAYAEPEKLGVDRFLGLVALHATVPGPTVLAGVGTALTLDALAADGTHLGGLIAPSPTLMQQALLGATARLVADSRETIEPFAAATGSAVRSGCWLAATALIERFHAETAGRLGGRPALVLAGGGAAALLPLLRVPARLEADLVLRGLVTLAGAGV